MTQNAAWRRSTRCSTGACVEIATGDTVLVRDSKLQASPVLEFDAAAWRGLLDDIRSGAISR